MRLTKNVNPTFYDYDIIYKELGHYLLNVSVHPMQYTYMKYPLIVESFNEIPSYMIFRFLYHDKLFDEIMTNFRQSFIDITKNMENQREDNCVTLCNLLFFIANPDESPILPKIR